MTSIQLSKPQFQLVTTEAPFPAFVGGFGSGKTDALVTKGIIKKSQYPTCDIAYYLPTFDLVSMIAMPRFEQKLTDLGIPHKVVKSPRPLILVENCGQIIFRTMDNPNRIVGYEVADSFIDEIDILKEDDAKNAWQKILARNRQKKPDGKQNTISVGTTPEGFKFVYTKWGKDQEKAAAEGYELIKASTYSNRANLPKNYIKDLIASYPTNLISAYIGGDFVNLTSGAVYPEFDRTLNGCSTLIQVIQGRPEDLHIGMDFNVTKMAAIVFVQREGWPHAVAEFTGIFDTPAMIKAIRARYPHNRVFIYPDASGSGRHSANASESDLSLLRAVPGFNVMVNSTNPAVKDRVLAVNVLVKTDGLRKLKVNVNNCPNFTEALEKQAYDKNGEPDKASGLDHPIDAGGYFVAYAFPVRDRSAKRIQISGT